MDASNTNSKKVGKTLSVTQWRQNVDEKLNAHFARLEAMDVNIAKMDGNIAQLLTDLEVIKKLQQELAVRVGTWAAIGALIGGGLMSLIIALLTKN